MTLQKTRGENAMASRATACPNLQAYYGLSAAQKRPYIENDTAVELLDSLPLNISATLVDCYLAGKPLTGKEGTHAKEYLLLNSKILPDLAEYPGTYTMLEKMYNFEKTHLPIDIFFSKSLPAGVSLESRFRTINEKAATHIRQVLDRQDRCLVLDLGSGPGRNGIALTLENPDFAERVDFHCIDTDPTAIEYGISLAKRHNLSNVKFIEQSMVKLHKKYRQSADYGLIVGVLCGLKIDERVGLLKIMKSYFKPGSRVIGAGLLDKMLEMDLFCSYILRETAGWILHHPPIGQVQAAFETAGYKYEGYFQEEPTRCYEIGIGIA